jgi:hypothetical protein
VLAAADHLRVTLNQPLNGWLVIMMLISNGIDWWLGHGQVHNACCCLGAALGFVSTNALQPGVQAIFPKHLPETAITESR